MCVFVADDGSGSGSDNNKSGSAEGNRSSSVRITDDDLHCVTDKESARILRTALHHDSSDGVSHSLQADNERTSTVQQLDTPVKLTPEHASNVPGQRDSRHDWDNWASWVRSTSLVGSGYIQIPLVFQSQRNLPLSSPEPNE